MEGEDSMRVYREHPRLKSLILPDVDSTDTKLGTGSYGTVVEVKMGGQVCAAKLIHEALVQKGANPEIAKRYIEEVQLLSDLRHPNIVQFLGICLLPTVSSLPLLVMEKMHTSLDDLLTEHAHTLHLASSPDKAPLRSSIPPAVDIPLGLKKSMFVDIVTGLAFLHNRVPDPIIHRDLTAKNVLLNSSMIAKISDLGNARIVDFLPGQLVGTFTRVPGTAVYMPPEAFGTPAHYGPKLDIFSFGHLVLYTIIQVFPCDLKAPTYTDDDQSVWNWFGKRLYGRSELERREPYIAQLHQQLGQEHPLVKLVEDCLANSAEERPSADTVLQRLEQMDITDSYEKLTKLDLIKTVEHHMDETSRMVRELEENNAHIQKRSEEMQQETEARLQSLTHRVKLFQDQVTQLTSEKEKTLAQHVPELESLSQQVSALSVDNSNLISRVDAQKLSLMDREQHLEERKKELELREEQLREERKGFEAQQQHIDSVCQQLQTNKETIITLREQISITERGLNDQLREKQMLFEEQLKAEKKRQASLEEKLSSAKNTGDSYIREIEVLSRDLDATRKECDSMEHRLQLKQSEVAVQKERLATLEKELGSKVAEIATVDACLSSKEKVLQSVRKELHFLRERGPEQVNFLHPGGASLELTHCANLPVKMMHGHAVQLKSTVYVQGEAEFSEETGSIYAYEIPEDAWQSMESPAVYSTLVVYRSQLLLVGGKETITQPATNELWALQGKEDWHRPIPRMPTARALASAVSSSNHLAVAGGYVGSGRYTEVVEVYDGEQWASVQPLPIAFHDIKSAYLNGMWYIMGSSKESTCSLVIYASLHSLISEDRFESNSAESTDSSEHRSVWKSLPEVPYQQLSIAALGGALVVIGGIDSMDTQKVTAAVQVYSPLSNWWIHAGNAPEAVKLACCVSLTTGEVMLIGGQREDGKLSKNVYKVMLTVE